MKDFLQRRSSLLIDEARQLAANGAGRQACCRVLATCDFLENSFGWMHRELPDLYELLGELHGDLGETDLATMFFVRSWQLRQRRERRASHLLAISRLEGRSIWSDAGHGSWPPAAGKLWSQLRDETLLHGAPEILVFGPPGSGKSRFLHTFGLEVIDVGSAVRIFQAYELIEHLMRAKRAFGLHRSLVKLDRFQVLLIDNLDPWGLPDDEAETIHVALLHRRFRRCTIMAIPSERLGESTVLSRVQDTRCLRCVGLGSVCVGL